MLSAMFKCTVIHPPFLTVVYNLSCQKPSKSPEHTGCKGEDVGAHTSIIPGQFFNHK